MGVSLTVHNFFVRIFDHSNIFCSSFLDVYSWLPHFSVQHRGKLLCFFIEWDLAEREEESDEKKIFTELHCNKCTESQSS